MSWYKAGTVAVTNGSTTVSGTGTDWFSALQNGWGFVGPDGLTYEIQTVNAADQLTLATPYRGATAANQSYSAFPTRALEQSMAESLRTLINDYSGVYNTVGQGRFQGDVVFDQDRDTGLTRYADNEVGLKAGGDLQLALKGGQARGAAVQADPLDGSAGRLLTTGAFGLGALALQYSQHRVDSVDDVTLAAGFYGVTDVTGGVKPSGASVYGTMQVVPLVAGGQSGTAQITQIYWPAFPEPEQYMRHYREGEGWSEWVSVLPQRGSNANGEFVRFADGTQICTRSVNLGVLSHTSVSGGLYRSDTLSFGFPATFVGEVAGGFTGDLFPSGVMYAVSTNATQWGVRIARLSGWSDFHIVNPIKVFAVGRWK